MDAATATPRIESPIPAPPARVRWDPLVRITHWGIAAAILLNGLITEEGSSPHVWIGYAAAGLLALRLLWGLIGTRPARFSAFPPSPGAAIRHLGDIIAGRRVEHRSHNPLGALMAYALWATLAIVAGTGIAMEQGRAAPPAASVESRIDAAAWLGYSEPAEVERAEARERGGEAEEEGEDMLGEIHEAAANLLFLLAALHVAGVAFESRRSGGGLVRAMIVGRGKSADG